MDFEALDKHFVRQKLIIAKDLVHNFKDLDFSADGRKKIDNDNIRLTENKYLPKLRTFEPRGVQGSNISRAFVVVLWTLSSTTLRLYEQYLKMFGKRGK